MNSNKAGTLACVDAMYRWNAGAQPQDKASVDLVIAPIIRFVCA